MKLKKYSTSDVSFSVSNLCWERAWSWQTWQKAGILQMLMWRPKHTESLHCRFHCFHGYPSFLFFEWGPMCQGNPLKNLWPMNHPKSLRHLTVHSCKLNTQRAMAVRFFHNPFVDLQRLKLPGCPQFWNFQGFWRMGKARRISPAFFCALFHFMLSEVAKISLEIFRLPGLEWSRPPQMAGVCFSSGRSLVSFTETISDCKKHLKLVPTRWKISKKIRSIAISRWDYWNAVVSCVFSWSCTSCSKIEQLHSK